MIRLRIDTSSGTPPSIFVPIIFNLFSYLVFGGSKASEKYPGILGAAVLQIQWTEMKKTVFCQKRAPA